MTNKTNIKKHFWKNTFSIIRNKYTFTLFFFAIWILFFDTNNLVDRVKNIKTLNKLKQQKEYYIQKIKEDQIHMQELISDKENLEKFARENYLMKKENEDIFIVIEQ